MSAQQSKSASEFKKKSKSSPSQIRAQFMSQVTGTDAPTPIQSKIQKTLRSTKDILSRLRSDTAYEIDDFVIGCIDRHVGIVEIPVAQWKDQQSQDCIAYFKDVKKGDVVWDRVSKRDLLFS